MKRLALILFLLLPVSAIPQELAFITGDKLSHNLSVCLDKDAAIAIVDADSKSGYEAASKLWAENDRCQSVPVMGGPRVGKVVHSAKIVRDGKSLTARVVEVIGEDNAVLGYFITTGTVAEKALRPGSVLITPDASLRNA